MHLPIYTHMNVITMKREQRDIPAVWERAEERGNEVIISYIIYYITLLRNILLYDIHIHNM